MLLLFLYVGFYWKNSYSSGKEVKGVWSERNKYSQHFGKNCSKYFSWQRYANTFNNGLEKNPSTNFNSKWSKLFKTVQKFKHILTNEQP